MTKYIRTKTNIVGAISALSNEELFDYLKQFDNYKDDLIKVADTIEEACDEFVIIHKELNGNHTIHRYNWLGKSEHKAGNDVYGAIWTDKGLIYVAKMNDEGELELL